MSGTLGATALSAVFAVLGIHALVRAVRHRGQAVDLVCDLLHALMCAVMVAMSWSWWSVWPALPQIIAFSLAAGWFALLALLQLAEGRTDASTHGPLHQGQHAVMMLAMVWMVVTMSAAPATMGHSMAMMPVGAGLLGVAFTGALAVSGLLQLAEAHESPPPRTGLRMMAAMDLAMALACWLMLLH